MSERFSRFLAVVENGGDLGPQQSREAFDIVLSGAVAEPTIAAFLLALREKGETPGEIFGAAQSMRSHSLTIQAPPDAIDIVGTGGDSLHTLNISTAVAFVVAGCGVPVAKHGNRSASSRSGSSDVLASLGISLAMTAGTLERCLNEIGLCFMHAPNHHPAMRHVASVRRQLGVRTIFNLLGPLTNPAGVRRHLIGVFDLEWLGPIGEILQMMATEKAWVVHGHDGMDEITTTTATDVVSLEQAQLRHFTLTPEQVRLPRTSLEALRGGDAPANAAALVDMLRGAETPYRDIVLFNAAAALVVAGRADTLTDGVALAAEAITSGSAHALLEKLRDVT